MSCIGKRRAAPAACRCCSCTGGPGPAAHRLTAASSTLPLTAYCCSTSAAPAVRRRARRRGPTPRSISSATLRTLRRHLSVDRWLVFGGSWGSTLALAYGQAHPERCLGFVLRGVFLGRRAEIDWFLHGMGTFFPEAHRAFLAPIPPEERGAGLLAAYHRRLMDRDPRVHLPAARAWSRYESACSALRPGPADTAAVAGDRAALGLARLEAHYFSNGLFLRDGQLLDELHRIDGLPATIVQGRYDVVCPIATADELARAWPGAEYMPVPEAGHSAMEFGIRSALVAATERMKYRLAATGVTGGGREPLNIRRGGAPRSSGMAGPARRGPSARYREAGRPHSSGPARANSRNRYGKCARPHPCGRR